MNRNEFEHYMDEQIVEIKKYQHLKIHQHTRQTPQQIALEWIERYARDFRQRWQESK